MRHARTVQEASSAPATQASVEMAKIVRLGRAMIDAVQMIKYAFRLQAMSVYAAKGTV